MADMIDVGLSGGFFHSRHGLITDYLGDEWFAAMEAALEVARRKDGYLWLYDEDLWPSGNAGGQVAGAKDEYRSTLLSAIMVAAGEPTPELGEDQEFRRCYVIKSREGLNLREFDQAPLDRLDDFCGYERLFAVREYTEKIGWWGGESYANLLHPEAMRLFVRMTHETYKQRLGSEFGARIPGIFTDEPQVSFRYNALAWFDGIPENYALWTGRDWWADLPYMFFDGPQSGKIRLLVHRAILRQFLEAYSRPIYEWCEQNGIEHTGHYMNEDSFYAQIMSHCGGVMAHYRYQHAPGIDHLCRNAHGALFTCKQVSSAARQLGRKRVLTEIFGVSRHTNTFEDFKWLGDYDLVLGANFFCPHLTWYSAKGRRKRDYPPVWNYQQTYWRDLKPLNDYFTRIGYALTRGEPVCDVLLLHSIESATCARRLGVEIRGSISDGAVRTPVCPPTEDMSAAHVFDHAMRKALEAVLNAGYECDLGDEGYIEDMGSVDGPEFRIGEMSYRLVIIPPSATWRPRTFELLEQFVSNGGKVIVLGELPAMLDCDDARADWVRFASHENVLSIACSVAEIQRAVDACVRPRFTLRGAGGRPAPHTYVHHRRDGDQDIIFVVNSDRSCERDYLLAVPDRSEATVAEWDAVEGTCRKLQPERTDSEIRLRFTLPPAGSLLLTVGGDVEPAQAPRRRPDLTAGKAINLGSEFDYELVDDNEIRGANVLPIDRIEVSFDGGVGFEPETPDWRLRRRLAERFGTQAALEWQPWVAIRKGLFEGKGGDIVLRYRFDSDLDRPRCWAVVEDLDKGELSVNGEKVRPTGGWHWDRAFKTADISDLVRRGSNYIDFRVRYDHLTEVEPAYVIGDFGVKLADPFRGKLTRRPEKLAVGSWTEQGFPFYAGRVVYKTQADIPAEAARVFLRLINPSGVLYRVRSNGRDVGTIMWRPWEIDLTGCVTPGANSIEIEVVSSLQNAWGPLHERSGDDNLWCGPNAFEDEGMLREEINSYPYGLLGGAEIVIL